MKYNYKCIVSKNGNKMYYKRVGSKWKRVSNAVGMKAEKGKRKYRMDTGDQNWVDSIIRYLEARGAVPVDGVPFRNYINRTLYYNIGHPHPDEHRGDAAAPEENISLNEEHIRWLHNRDPAYKINLVNRILRHYNLPLPPARHLREEIGLEPVGWYRERNYDEEGDDDLNYDEEGDDDFD